MNITEIIKIIRSHIDFFVRKHPILWTVVVLPCMFLLLEDLYSIIMKRLRKDNTDK